MKVILVPVADRPECARALDTAGVQVERGSPLFPRVEPSWSTDRVAARAVRPRPLPEVGLTATSTRLIDGVVTPVR